MASDKVSDGSSDRCGYKFRVKSTFIEISSEEPECSRRPSSDPGSVTGDSTSRFDLTEHYDQYMTELSGAMSQIWSYPEKSQGTQFDKEEELMASGAGPGTQVVAHDVLESGTSVAHGIPSLPATAIDRDGRLDGIELKAHIRYAQREAEKRLHQRRKKAVLSAIQEIPDQVNDALQKSAMGIVGDVMEEVAVVKDMIEGDDSAREQVGINSMVAKLEVIPDMIQDSFEAHFSKAERTVRAHVDHMIHNLETSDLANEQVVKKMWAIPTEVQQITNQAMQAAVVESRVQAQLQIDCALASLPNQSEDTKRLAGVAELHIMPQVPTDTSKMVQGANSAVVDTVEQAVAEVEKEDTEMTGVANQVVAETLLRAKVETSNATRGDESAPIFASGANEGSIGHPELCARPCLYFAKGECTNGISCNFCHLDHPRRPVHPDKKNRQLLKEMPFPECVAVLTPILKEKVEELGLGVEVTLMMDDFASNLAGVPLGDETLSLLSDQTLGGRRKKQLQEFLRSMTLRSVMALLMRAAPTVPQREAVDVFTGILRAASDRRQH